MYNRNQFSGRKKDHQEKPLFFLYSSLGLETQFEEGKAILVGRLTFICEQLFFSINLDKKNLLEEIETIRIFFFPLHCSLGLEIPKEGTTIEVVRLTFKVVLAS